MKQNNKINNSIMDSESDYDVLNAIRTKKASMSKGHKKIADYVLKNVHQCAFFTATQLGEKAGVSESTAVRFPAAIGLSGYPEFQQKLALVVQDKIKSFDKIDILQSDLTEDVILDNVLTMDAKKIEHTIKNVDRDAFKIAIDDILSANHVYIIGVRNSEPLAAFLGYYLKVIREGVTVVKMGGLNEMFEDMMHLTPKDVVVGISFPRYSMKTLKAMEYANNRNARVIAITDSKHSPMNMYSSCNLFASSDMASVVESMVAPMSLINALIVSMCVRRNTRVAAYLENLKNTVEDYSFEGNDEINMLDDNIIAELKSITEFT